MYRLDRSGRAFFAFASKYTSCVNAADGNTNRNDKGTVREGKILNYRRIAAVQKVGGQA